MARMSKAQKKRMAIAMLSKAEKLAMAEAISFADVAAVMKIKQKCLKRMGYDPIQRR